MILCMKITINVFSKLTISFFLLITSYLKSTQNSKFVISLQYLKKEGRDEVDFCMQININFSYRLILLIWAWSGIPKLL